MSTTEACRDEIQPETQALEAYIQATVTKVLSEGDAVDSHGLLFLGNRHDAMPRWIFQDPVLQPVDTRIWGVIKIAAATGPTAFPTYKQIAALANVGSETTVARSMAILRATRWLSLCRRVRDPQGKHRGNVYALHDEPLPLTDALYLDQEYMQFLEQARTHGHPQVCKVATAVLATIAEDLEAGDVESADQTLQRRLSSTHAVEHAGHRYFAFSSRQLQILKSAPATESLQNLKPAPLQKLKSDGSSSSYIYKNTTTTTEETTHSPARTREHDAFESLALPAWLSPNERHLARLCLSKAPAEDHQDIVDEFSARVLSARARHRPVTNPIGYLARMCQAARQGAFQLTSLGLKTREFRQREPVGDGGAITVEAHASSNDTLAPATGDRSASVSRAPVASDGGAISVDPHAKARACGEMPCEADGRAITANASPPDGHAIRPTPTPTDKRSATGRAGDASRHRALQEMRRALGVAARADAPPSPLAGPAGDGAAITLDGHSPEGGILRPAVGDRFVPHARAPSASDGGAIRLDPHAKASAQGEMPREADGRTITPGTGPPFDVLAAQG